MMDSILDSTKKKLGIDPDYYVFDTDIIDLINMNLATLCQMGIGPQEGFFIQGKQETWNDFIGDNVSIRWIQTYIFLKTKMLFDPPQSSFVATAYENQIKQLEIRLYTQAGQY